MDFLMWIKFMTWSKGAESWGMSANRQYEGIRAAEGGWDTWSYEHFSIGRVAYYPRLIDKLRYPWRGTFETTGLMRRGMGSDSSGVDIRRVYQ